MHRHFSRLLLTLCTLLVTTNGLAQPSSLKTPEFRDALYPPEVTFERVRLANTWDGLDGRFIRMAQDSVGFMWFGTHYRLYRFDGCRTRADRSGAA